MKLTKAAFPLIFISFIIVIAVLHASCGDNLKPKWEYLVDNPLNYDITIKIDEKEYVIPAKTTVPVEVTQGKHTVTYNGSTAKFVTKVNNSTSVTIMNPTLSNYMLHAYIFVCENARSKNTSRLYEQNSYEYDSDFGVVKLPVQVVNSLFIDRTHSYWSFGLDEDTTSAVRSTNPSKQVIYKKLFREDDYFREFAGELPPGIVFPVNPWKLSDQPAYVFPVELLMCDCEAANEAIRQLGKKCDDVIANSDDLFQDVEQLAHHALTDVFSEMNEKCSSQYNPGRNDSEYQKTFEALGQTMKYMTDASTFIVK